MTTSAILPPEAYTREVLVKAYDWLANQTANVRDRATSADALVALYLQAKRRRLDESGSTRTVEPPSTASVEAFKEDLRNLAEGLRQFDDPLAPPPQQATRVTPPSSAASPLEGFVTDWHSGNSQASTAPPPQYSPPTDASTVTNPHNWPAPSFGLDARSRAWVQDVQRKLNLASESDALRALIAVGYERFGDILPDT